LDGRQFNVGSGDPADARTERIVARSFYGTLRESGYCPRELLAVCTELIDLVTRDLESHARSSEDPANTESR
jgi:hypothetical protein